jgi:general nucleoside transport system ATP-binding protein
VSALPTHRSQAGPDVVAVLNSLSTKQPAMSLQAVSVADDSGRTVLHNVTLDLFGGEILGIAGVAGSGQLPLYDALLGLRVPSAGRLLVGGQPMAKPTPRSVRGAGVIGIPEDPVRDAVVPGMSVIEHIALDELTTVRKGLGIDWDRADALYAARNQASGLRAADGVRQLQTLSGGNIQRVVLVRALGGSANVIVAAYPSRGLDIATTRRTQELLLEHREAGRAVLLISEDLDELCAFSDRIAVLRDGAVQGVVSPASADRYDIGRLMLGVAA